jgi:hypothetical protein
MILSADQPLVGEAIEGAGRRWLNNAVSKA